MVFILLVSFDLVNRKVRSTLKISTLVLAFVLVASVFGETNVVELAALKDTFGRSYTRNANRGKSEYLMISSTPAVCSIIGFDLSSITNEIIAAEFSFCARDAEHKNALSFTIAPMVGNEQNNSWIEGTGFLNIGENAHEIQKSEAANNRPARFGEPTFQWRAFRDKPWLNQDGKPVRNLMDQKLWYSTQSFSVEKGGWEAGRWIVCPIQDSELFEEIRKTAHPVVTIGIWGTSGKGSYLIHSREAGQAARLTLTLKPEEKK